MAVQLLKFEADWCGPCTQQSEILTDFDAAPVEVIDIDEQQNRASEYSIRSVPTLVVEQDGEEVERFIGLTQLGEIESAVESYK